MAEYSPPNFDKKRVKEFQAPGDFILTPADKARLEYLKQMRDNLSGGSASEAPPEAQKIDGEGPPPGYFNHVDQEPVDDATKQRLDASTASYAQEQAQALALQKAQEYNSDPSLSDSDKQSMIAESQSRLSPEARKAILQRLAGR